MKKISHMSHGLADPARMKPVEFHSGMTTKQTDAANIGGQGHPTAKIDGGQAVASSAAAPLAHAYSGRPDLKRGRAVMVHPSHSRGAVADDDMRQLGDAILREAVLNGGK
ncbi:MAG TPA: hypothetical protein VN742_09650 [Candidatus Binataceae bacterium]|nr:hypothetical protein [Candidatus Binataceae bacterium]